MKTKITYQVSAILFFVLLLLIQTINSYSQSPPSDTSKKSFKLFEEDRLIEISLQFDLTTYFRSKPQKEYLKTKITFNPGTSDSVTKDIRLKTRGIFRNRYCMFAPIELNFKKTDFGYTDLNSISKLKLVPQCGPGKDDEDYVLREYLAYKLYNVLTDTSFRVRLLKVNYIDTNKKKKSVTQYGIFLEPVEMLLTRTNCLQIKSTAINQKSIIPKIMDRVAIFNFMIGNYDWSVPGQHNITVMKSKGYEPTGLGIAIPHDFDWTGLVNPTYAVPTEEVGTENVRERIFTGVCRSKETYSRELDLFLGKKPEFYKVINDFPYVSQKVKKDMTGYLDGFFDLLTGPKDRILYNFTNMCKNF
jgi:hypothetical protein